MNRCIDTHGAFLRQIQQFRWHAQSQKRRNIAEYNKVKKKNKQNDQQQKDHSKYDANKNWTYIELISLRKKKKNTLVLWFVILYFPHIASKTNSIQDIKTWSFFKNGFCCVLVHNCDQTIMMIKTRTLTLFHEVTINCLCLHAFIWVLFPLSLSIRMHLTVDRGGFSLFRNQNTNNLCHTLKWSSLLEAQKQSTRSQFGYATV